MVVNQENGIKTLSSGVVQYLVSWTLAGTICRHNFNVVLLHNYNNINRLNYLNEDRI